MPIEISDPGDERVRDYFSLTDVKLRSRLDPERGLYLAESEKVIRRALGAGHRPRSFLMGQRWVTDLSDLVATAESQGVPVYVAQVDVIEAMTGFHLHRGALASMHRPPLVAPQELLRNALVFSETRWEEALDEELRGLRTGAARLKHVLLVTVDPKSHFSEQRALWNEVWSTLRFDDDLRPLVEHYYRAWLERIVALVEEGRSDGSVPKRVNAADAGWRLAAAADGFDALLYVGLATREDARRLLLGALQRELAG